MLGLLALTKRLHAHDEEEEKEPSAVSKVVAKIPTKVKVATVFGAVKGGGGEAMHEVGDKVRRMVRYGHENERKHHSHNGRNKRHRV